MLILVAVILSLAYIQSPVPAPTATPTAIPTPTPTVSPTPTPTPEQTPSPEPTSIPTPIDGHVYYVATDGADSNVGDLTRPFRTVSKGLASLRAGDTLYLRGGTYVEDVSPTLRSGTAKARITVRNYPGEKPTIKGRVHLYSPDYWTFDGFNVTWNTGNFTDHMVKFIGGRDWILENSQIWGAKSFANVLVCCSPSNWVMRNNTIYDAYGGESNIFRSHNLYVNTNLDAGPGLIEHNLFFNAPHGCNIKIAGPDQGSQYGSANVTVRYNTLSSGVQPLLIGDGSTNILVERNIIVTGVRPGTTTYLLRLYRLTGANNIVRNNLGFDAGKWCLDYDGGDYTCASIDGEGNRFAVNPEFDSIGLGGFHPQNPTSQDYGKYAIHSKEGASY
jgi:hypothetical protein